MKPGEILVTLDNVSVSYDSTEVLKGASFDIYKDDYIGIIGPNGGGKTTLVKAILKTIPYSGSIRYSRGIEHGGKRRIGYLPQNSDIDRAFPISVKEVVLSGLQGRKGLFGRYDKTDRGKAETVMSLCGIDSLAHRHIGGLSGGEFQRCLLGRAIISGPKLLILDEPANFVDNVFEKELYAILKKLSEKMAIIMVSHDLGTISSQVKTIVCVNRHVHRHDSNIITPEQLHNYNCPIQVVYHEDIPHTVLGKH